MNQELFISYLKRRGLNFIDLSKVVGMTLIELKQKVTGDDEPTRAEMLLMVHYLRLSKEEVYQLFLVEK